MSYGIYLHTPLCARKCPYCDFYSAAFPAERVGPLVRAVEREMIDRRHLAPAPRAGSLYLGGGTPSLLPVWALRRLLEGVESRLGLAEGAEITVEVNPDSFTVAKAAALQELGVNRISVGVQSLDDDLLRFLGRPYDAELALEAARRARAMFDAVSFDLLYAVPGMTPALLDATLTGLLELDPDHLSAYELTIETGTPFAASRDRGDWAELGAEECLELDALVEERAGQAGLRRYEVSNYARPGGECRHNLDIWRGGWYLGLGPGAHSRLPAAGSWGRWSANLRDLDLYVARLEEGASPEASAAELDAHQHREELLLLGLRLAEGLDLRVLGGQQPPLDPQVVDRLTAGGFLELEATRLRATAAGRRVLDEVIAQLAVALAPAAEGSAPPLVETS